MAEYPITVTEVPSTACYPSTPQQLLNILSNYITVQIDEVKQTYVVSDAAPSSENIDKPWFQTYASGSGYGLPKVVRWYSNGQWKEFAQLKQGDMILVNENSTISSPWGETGHTYYFGDTNLPSYTPPTLPTPTEGFKYKVYVGFWSTMS